MEACMVHHMRRFEPVPHLELLSFNQSFDPPVSGHAVRSSVDVMVIWSELDLSENLIEKLQADALHGVRVRSLRLDRNNIQEIDDAAFRGVGSETEIVDMSHNRLTELRLVTVFEPLPSLQTVRLRYNQLVRLHPDTAAVGSAGTISSSGRGRTLPAVVELDLTGNELDHVPSAALASLPVLRRLILRDNRIRVVGPSAFHGTPFLETVDLGANRGGSSRGSRTGGPLVVDVKAFCGLEPRAFSRQPGVTDWTGLQRVRLDHNGLSNFDACSLASIWTLTSLELSGNPLRCDCRLLSSIRRLTESATGLRLDPVTQCASPDRVAGRKLIDAVTDEGRECPSDIGRVAVSTCVQPCGEGERGRCGSVQSCGTALHVSAYKSVASAMAVLTIRLQLTTVIALL